MNIFDTLKVYAGKWSVKSVRAFDAEEIKAVKSAEVVPSQYGNSVVFAFVAGGQSYIPLSNDSTASVGDIVDLEKAEIITLEKEGETDIVRIKVV